MTAAKTSRRTEPFATSAVQFSGCLSALSADALSAWLLTVQSLMLARVQQVYCLCVYLRHILVSRAACSNKHATSQFKASPWFLALMFDVKACVAQLSGLFRDDVKACIAQLSGLFRDGLGRGCL